VIALALTVKVEVLLNLIVYANHRVLKGSRKFVHKLKQYVLFLLTQSYAHAFFPAIIIPLSG